MSSTNQQKLAKRVAQEFGIGYQCSLEWVRNAAQTRQLRYPLTDNVGHNLEAILAITTHPLSRKNDGTMYTNQAVNTVCLLDDQMPLIDRPGCLAVLNMGVYKTLAFDVEHDQDRSGEVSEIACIKVPDRYVEYYDRAVQDTTVKTVDAALRGWFSADNAAWCQLYTPYDGCRTICALVSRSRS